MNALTRSSLLVALASALGSLGVACAAPEGDGLDATEAAISSTHVAKPVREAIRVSCTTASVAETPRFDFLYDDASNLRGTLLGREPVVALTEVPVASRTGALAVTGTRTVLRAGSAGRAYLVDRFLPRFMHSEDRAFAAKASSITVVEENGAKEVMTCTETSGGTPAGEGAFAPLDTLLPPGTYRGSGRTMSALCAVRVEHRTGASAAFSVTIAKRDSDDTPGETLASIALDDASSIERMLLTNESNVVYLEAHDASGKKRGLVIDRAGALHRVSIVSYGSGGASTAICDEK